MAGGEERVEGPRGGRAPCLLLWSETAEDGEGNMKALVVCSTRSTVRTRRRRRRHGLLAPIRSGGGGGSGGMLEGAAGQ